MISYAQNCEDVLLERLFAEVACGFYIDVGANDPVTLSVTKHFSERGWRGINIEPLPDACRRLQQDRPRDVTLNVGIASRRGELTFYECLNNDALSTFSVEQAQRHRQAGWQFSEHAVPVLTLAEVVRDYVSGTVDFLSIDVEGFEEEVLAGANLAEWRPRVVLIEATLPETGIPRHGVWESWLLDAGYRFAYFDGLNRFYVRQEDAGLIERLRVPVNVNDGFVRHESILIQQALRERDAALQEKEVALYEKDAALRRVDADLRQKDEALQEALDSARRLQTQLDNKETTLLSVLEENQSLVRQLQEKEAALFAALEEEHALIEQLRDKERALWEQIEEHRRLQAQLEDKHAALESLQTQAEYLRQALEEKEAALASKHAALVEALASCRQLTADLQAKEEALLASYRHNQDLQQQLVDKHAALHQALGWAEEYRQRLLGHRPTGARPATPDVTASAPPEAGAIEASPSHKHAA